MLQIKELKKYDLKAVYDKIQNGQRLSLEDGLKLYDCPDPLLVGALAHYVREKKHGLRTSYVLNQQINYTNICVNRCLFCSYHRKSGQKGAFQLSHQDIQDKIKAHLQEPICEIHIVGGCHPDLSFSFYEQMLKIIKKLRPEAILKCFTPVEIDHFARLEDVSIVQVLERLQKAGLQMLPGGGAEIFNKEIRDKICPQKISSSKWLEIMQTAHGLGLKTNCTMLFGHLESPLHRLEHMDELRKLQDQTQGFLCFIPLPYQTQNNKLNGIQPLSGLDKLKTIAVSRLMLDNIAHIKSYWVMLGLKLSQIALYFGADDLDGTVVEEKIGHMAGADSPQILSRKELESMITRCAMEPVRRNALFQKLN